MAIKALYRADLLGKGDDRETMVEGLSSEGEHTPEVIDFAEKLVVGLADRMEEVDKVLASALDGWTPERLGYMERAIMRLALFEMLFYPDTPEKVAVNEAVDLAKTYCDAESPRLVNGALDKILKGKNA